MPSLPDPHRELTRQSEAVARAWALLAAVLVSITTQLVYLQTVDYSDDGPDSFAEEPTSVWSGLGEVIFTDRDDYGVDGPDGLGGLLAFGQVGFALLAIGLVLAVAVAVRWLGDGDLAELEEWKPRVVAAVLAVGVVAVVVCCSQLGEPGEDDLRKGMDAAAGLWGPLGAAIALVATPMHGRWPRPRTH